MNRYWQKDLLLSPPINLHLCTYPWQKGPVSPPSIQPPLLRKWGERGYVRAWEGHGHWTPDGWTDGTRQFGRKGYKKRGWILFSLGQVLREALCRIKKSKVRQALRDDFHWEKATSQSLLKISDSMKNVFSRLEPNSIIIPWTWTRQLS